MIKYKILNLVYIVSNVLKHSETSGASASKNITQSKMPIGSNILMFVVIYGIMMFVFFILPSRSRKKRELAVKKMHENISAGNNVLVTGGLYGKIVDIYEDLYIVEFGMNKSVRIPVNKYDILEVKEPNLNSIKKDKNDVDVNNSTKDKSNTDTNLNSTKKDKDDTQK